MISPSRDGRFGSDRRGRSRDNRAGPPLWKNPLLFADDFGTDRTFVFDLNDATNPLIRSLFTTAGPFGWPHSYVRLPSGNRLLTYQFQASRFNLPPAGIAEARPDGTIVRWASASTVGVNDKEITPYSLEILPALDRVGTTSTSMIEDTGIGVQFWRLSDLKLLHSLRIPTGNPHAAHMADTMLHHLLPAEPRLLGDGNTVMFGTFTCGLYTLTHWLARDGSGERIVVVNGGSKIDATIYLLRFDPATGALSRDAKFPTLDMSSVAVPRVGVVRGVPPATVFSH